MHACFSKNICSNLICLQQEKADKSYPDLTFPLAKKLKSLRIKCTMLDISGTCIQFSNMLIDSLKPTALFVEDMEEDVINSIARNPTLVF